MVAERKYNEIFHEFWIERIEMHWRLVVYNWTIHIYLARNSQGENYFLKITTTHAFASNGFYYVFGWSKQIKNNYLRWISVMKCRGIPFFFLMEIVHFVSLRWMWLFEFSDTKFNDSKWKIAFYCRFAE